MCWVVVRSATKVNWFDVGYYYVNSEGKTVFYQHTLGLRIDKAEELCHYLNGGN